MELNMNHGHFIIIIIIIIIDNNQKEKFNPLKAREKLPVFQPR